MARVTATSSGERFLGGYTTCPAMYTQIGVAEEHGQSASAVLCEETTPFEAHGGGEKAPHPLRSRRPPASQPQARRHPSPRIARAAQDPTPRPQRSGGRL